MAGPETISGVTVAVRAPRFLDSGVSLGLPVLLLSLAVSLSRSGCVWASPSPSRRLSGRPWLSSRHGTLTSRIYPPWQ